MRLYIGSDATLEASRNAIAFFDLPRATMSDLCDRFEAQNDIGMVRTMKLEDAVANMTIAGVTEFKYDLTVYKYDTDAPAGENPAIQRLTTSDVVALYDALAPVLDKAGIVLPQELKVEVLRDFAPRHIEHVFEALPQALSEELPEEPVPARVPSLKELVAQHYRA